MQEWMYLVACGVLLILTLIILSSRNKAVKAKKAAERELQDSLLNLDAVYSEVNTTQEELNAKYRELKSSEDKIKKLAYEDQLTGLPNKAAFTEVLGSTLSTLRKNEFIAVMHLDLDDFKNINNMWGEPLGDELILDISHRLKSNLDGNDYLVRSGSDEFYILTQNITDIDAYEDRVKKVQNIFRFPFVLPVNEFTITISIGVAIAPKDGKTVASILKHSDSALAEAKWLGKNTYCYYTEAIEQKELEEIELKSELNSSIKEGNFFATYQRVRDITDNTVLALRAELKWDRKEKGIWNAGHFTGFAEKTGQIVPIGEHVFREVCDEIIRKRRDEGKSYKVILPITRRQFINLEFENGIRSIVEEKGLELSDFVFEINERMLLTDYEDFKYMMLTLAEQGFRFRLGNFGSGLMALKGVRELPVEEVVISYADIFDGHDNAEADETFRLLTELIRDMGKRVVISSADSEEATEKLQKMGLKIVQG